MPVISVIIKSGQQVIIDVMELLSIDINKEFNKIPRAELRLIGGNIASQEFKVLESDLLEPGKEIEITLSYQGNAAAGATVFTGIVTNQALELNQSGATLIIELSDKAVAMTQTRQNGVYTKVSDSDVIKKLITRNNLKAGVIAPTAASYAEMVQYYATDWDFILSRVDANGQLLTADNGTISTIQPMVADPALQLELGIDTIYNFELQADSRHQYQQVHAVAWDVTRQQVITSAKGQEFPLSQGNYNVATIAQSIGGTRLTLMHTAALDPKEIKSWADAQVMKSRLSLIRGWICVPGNTTLSVGDTIAIKGVSNRFTGKNIVSGIRHEVTSQHWFTYIHLGMDAGWFTATPQVVDSRAAGLLPGINGLQVGVITPYENDPDNQSRVKVQIPAFGSNQGAVWARLLSLDAGKERGLFFRPEAGDEVIVGFLNDDPRQAIILGSLHSSANKTPLPVTPTNSLKGIVTKLKYQLLFDEEQGTITLATSQNNSIRIDEKNNVVTLHDANGNQLTLNNQGVTINSDKDCIINTNGNFEINAKKNITIKGKKVDLT